MLTGRIGTNGYRMQYLLVTQLHTPQRDRYYTPFELVCGHQVILSSALSNSPKPSYTYDDYTQELKERLQIANQIANENLKNEKQKAKEYHDKKAKTVYFKVGDKVLLHDETIRRG